MRTPSRPLLVKVPFHTVHVGSVYRESSQNTELGSPGTLNANLSGCMHVCLSLFVFFFPCLSVGQSEALSVSRFVRLCTGLSAALFAAMSVCLSDSVSLQLCINSVGNMVCLQISLSAFLSVCLLDPEPLLG